MLASVCAKASRRAHAPPMAALAPSGGSPADADAQEALVRAAIVDASPQGFPTEVVSGFRLASPLEAALLASWQVASAGREETDDDVARVAEHFLSDRMQPLSSRRVVAETIGVSDQKLAQIMQRLAAAVLLTTSSASGSSKRPSRDLCRGKTCFCSWSLRRMMRRRSLCSCGATSCL